MTLQVMFFLEKTDIWKSIFTLIYSKKLHLHILFLVNFMVTEGTSELREAVKGARCEPPLGKSSVLHCSCKLDKGISWISFQPLLPGSKISLKGMRSPITMKQKSFECEITSAIPFLMFLTECLYHGHLLLTHLLFSSGNYITQKRSQIKENRKHKCFLPSHIQA